LQEGARGGLSLRDIGATERAAADRGHGMNDRTFTAIATLDELPSGEKKAVTVGGVSILLCHTEGGIFAVRNECSHAQEALDCGRMRGGWISCPAHGARFDLESGEPFGPPATQPIPTFEVRVVGDIIEVAV
jgi:3-phenylpropionate/trans-cinnamate dioxygenase ferredoxin subunit